MRRLAESSLGQRTRAAKVAIRGGADPYYILSLVVWPESYPDEFWLRVIARHEDLSRAA